ncbi:SCO4983 family protein [Streptomyces beihaiensis]|uniref:HPt domain-containing protein n=1 Tax=Streptomyces beihaiensis TaxID=2984495 RepID=A0ABT3U2G5_9ACTN|nr:hypothetical protein [Streptomyces beihaiensis]MCX3062398.1 hypothetical protein [Streptomyces beihaiensis]
MYEPIRTPSRRSVHSTAADPDTDGFPRRTREEELDIQLAGHLAALLALTDELRQALPDGGQDLAGAADALTEQVARLRGGHPPVRAEAAAAAPDVTALHRRAHAVAGRALVVAASRADTAAAILAAQRMEAHAAGAEAAAVALTS